jgi:hypothetical protein
MNSSTEKESSDSNKTSKVTAKSNGAIKTRKQSSQLELAGAELSWGEETISLRKLREKEVQKEKNETPD